MRERGGRERDSAPRLGSARVAAILSGLALVLVLSVAWLALRSAGEGPPGAPGAPGAVELEGRQPAAAGDADAAERLAPVAETQSPAGRDGAPARTEAAAAAGDAGRGSAAAAERRLDVRVVDARTRAPIPDLGLLVYREQGGLQVLDRARTNADGRARFPAPESGPDEPQDGPQHGPQGAAASEREQRPLDADVLLVESERRPPFAPRLGAAWVPSGGRAQIELAAGTGGRIEGRVLDDSGAPLEGAEFFLDERASGLSPIPRRSVYSDEPAATSDPDGRFAITAVRSRPAGVWIVDGSPRPERWDPVRIWVRYRDAQSLEEIHVDEHETASLEVVLPRARTCAGRVLDEHGAPVAGAVVTPYVEAELTRLFGRDGWISKRSGGGDLDGPGTGGGGANDATAFELRAGEVRTDASGAFEVERRRSPWHLGVIVPDGRVQVFPVPELALGEAVRSAELRLRAETRLVLHFDPVPERVDFSSLRVRLRLRDDSELSVYQSTPGAVFDTRWPVRPDEIAALMIDLAGYQPWQHVFEASPRNGDALTIALAAKPMLRLEFRPLTAADEDSGEPQPPFFSLDVRACLARKFSDTCCGYGSQRFRLLPVETEEWRLHVARDAPYWVHARGLGAEDELATFGPWFPGPEVRVIEFTPRARPTRPPEAPAVEPPPPSRPPSGRSDQARLVATILDADSGEPVDAILSAQARGLGRAQSGRLDAELPPGTHELHFTHDNYEASAPERIELAPGDALDLGTIFLTPLPVWRARFVGEDGADLPAEFQVSAHEAGDGPLPAWFWRRGAKPGATVELGSRLPESFALAFVEAAPSLTWGSAWTRLFVERWDPSAIEVIEVPPPRPVEVVVEGLAPEYAETTLMPRVAYPEGHALNIDGVALAWPKEIAGAPRRTFRCLLAPGSYVLTVDCALYDFAPLGFDVTAGDATQTITVVPR